MKVAIYCRASTEEQNPENQVKDCQSINKYGEFELFIDKQSAWKDNVEREGFNRLLKEIKSRKVEHLIVWDLDRLYRNRERLIEFFKLCKVYGCKIHSYRQKWLEELNGVPKPWDEILHELMIQIMGWMAEEESSRKSKRVKAAIRIREDGAYSYKGNKWGRKKLSTFKMNRIIELRKEGKSIRAISQELAISHGVVHKYITQNVVRENDK